MRCLHVSSKALPEGGSVSSSTLGMLSCSQSQSENAVTRNAVTKATGCLIETVHI